MDLQFILSVRFYGEPNELEKIEQLVNQYQRDYEDRDLEVVKQLAVACGIEKEKADFFIDELHPARLAEVSKFHNQLFVDFTTHPWTAILLKSMMLNIKGACKCTWLYFGNHIDSATFYDEELQKYTDELLTAKNYLCFDEADEDRQLYNEEEDLYFELDSLEESLNYWCEYNKIDPEEYTQEQLIELISQPNEDFAPVVSFFKKETYIPPYAYKTMAKIIFKGDEDTILEIYNAAKYAIDDYSGDFYTFVEDYNEDDDYSYSCKLLDAKCTQNDGQDCELEITAVSYFDPLKGQAVKADISIIDDFYNLKDYISETHNAEILANVYLVSNCDLSTDCQIDDEDCPQVGYLSVNAQDEFGEAANFLMCDYLDRLIDRWCELVHYDGDRKEATEMLDLINNYSYQKESTKIQAGLISAND